MGFFSQKFIDKYTIKNSINISIIIVRIPDITDEIFFLSHGNIMLDQDI